MKKINKKFIRNIIIVLIALVITEKIIDIAPGYKREKQTDEVKIILNENEITEELINPIYINQNKTIYISKDDIQKFFDETIYYDENYDKIVTTSNTKVADMKINEKTMNVNETEVSLLDSAIWKEEKIFIPISELELIYNINIDYIEDKKTVIIDELNKGMIVANFSENVQIKYKARALSKDVGEATAGMKVYCFYTTSRGWREIRTEDGILGYVKANKLTNEYILRQDMQTEILAIKLENINKKEPFLINEKETVIKKLTDKDIEDAKSKYNVWIEVSGKNLENEINKAFEDYKMRAQIIKQFVDLAITNKIQGININFIEMQDTEKLQRFIIELAPRLREAGVKISIETNNKANEKDFEKYVEYIIHE